MNMKKLAIAICALTATANVQAQALNEVELNIFNTIVNQSIEIGYEHFIDRDQSVGIDLLINDRFSFGGKDDEHASGLYAQPFLKYRFGDYEKAVRLEEGGYGRETVDMNSFIIGVGAGYKLVKNDAFTVSPFVNIARNFNEDVADEFMGIEINAGINIGYRF